MDCSFEAYRTDPECLSLLSSELLFFRKQPYDYSRWIGRDSGNGFYLALEWGHFQYWRDSLSNSQHIQRGKNFFLMAIFSLSQPFSQGLGLADLS